MFIVSARVFNSARLGVYTPKNFSPYAQILSPNQSAPYYVYLSIINWELTSKSVFECFVSSKNFRWVSCFWISFHEDVARQPY